MRGRGLSARVDVCACMCGQGPAGDLLHPMNPPTMIYLLCPYPTSAHTDTQAHTDGHMISSISVIRRNLQMWLFFLVGTGQAGENGVWCRRTDLSPYLTLQ